MKNARCKWEVAGWQVCKLRVAQSSISNLVLAICHWSLVILLLTGCSTNQTTSAITASGFIEGTEVTIASEVSGRIAEMLVDRGDTVQEGDVLVRLDDAVLQSQRMEAEAGLAAAQANLDRVQAGARPEEIDATRAALAQAEAERDGAVQAVVHAQDVISNPLSLDAEIDAARTEVRLGEQNVEMAQADLAEMRLWHGLHVGEGGDSERTWDLQLQASEDALVQAQAKLAGDQRYLDGLLAIRADPLELEAQLHTAQTQADLAQAQVGAAQAALDERVAGPTDEQVAIAQAQVQQAEAAVRLVDAQIAQLTLTAPISGVVTSRSAQAGETASAGAPLLTVANLDEVTLVIYVPENRVGQVSVGQEAQVTVDSFPTQAFVGHVSNIAGKAEFTPSNVQTKEERVNLVFAVKVTIPNPDHKLKLGMPADATIEPSAGN
jgi:HlyD family secretion protein